MQDLTSIRGRDSHRGHVWKPLAKISSPDGETHVFEVKAGGLQGDALALVLCLR